MGLIGIAALSIMSSGLATSNAQATVITFDDLPSNFQQVPNGYAGLNWTNWWTLAPASYVNNPSGYQNSLVSPDNIIWQAANLNGDNATGIFSSTPFTLNSFYATAAWRDGLTVTVIGYLNNVLQDISVFTVSTFGPTLEVFNWSGIDQVNLLTSGGTPHDGYQYSAYEVALDNLTINATPLPSTWTMMLIGLAGLGFVAYRRQKQKVALAAA
jgi:hypothetical protein